MPTGLDENFPLSYREREQEVPIGTNVGADDDIIAAPFDWPEDYDEEIIVPIKISQRQFTAILSSIDVGGPLAYADDGFLPYWWFARNFMGGAMDICQLIIDCIQNNDIVQSTIREFLTSDEQFRDWLDMMIEEHTLSSEDEGKDLIATETCDKDILFGKISATVDLLNVITRDFYQSIEGGTNILERASLLVSAVPVIGAIVHADEILELADQVLENAYEEYEDAYDASLYDDIRCALFCEFQDDCVMSIADLKQWYAAQTGAAIPADPINALRYIVEYLVTGGITTDAFVYISHLLMLELISASQNVMGIDFGQLQLRIAAADTPNNDWVIICDPCQVLECVSFADEMNGSYAYPTTNDAQWSVGDGWSQDGSGGVRIILTDTVLPAQIDRIEIRFSRPWEGATTNPDYDKFFGQIESASGTAGTVSFGQGLDPLRTGQTVTIDAPIGTYWDRGDLIVWVLAGGGTWPQNPPNTASFQSIIEICARAFVP